MWRSFVPTSSARSTCFQTCIGFASNLSVIVGVGRVSSFFVSVLGLMPLRLSGLNRSEKATGVARRVR